MKTEEIISTKVTRLGTGEYGCRVFCRGKLLAETKVPSRRQISIAFKSILRMVDKLGFASKMADCSRHRQKNWETRDVQIRIKWYWSCNE